MKGLFEGLPFGPADILLPQNCPMELWSVVACDQYTSQPEYWQRVEARVGDSPSALGLILPECRLEEAHVDRTIGEIRRTMEEYLSADRFCLYPESLFYVERTLSNGRIRRGLVGVVDLESYDYTPGSASPIRATEGTVLSRIPPRMQVRRNAPMELPHTMLLMDDPRRTVIEPLTSEKGEMEALYDFELMEGGGRIRGWRLTEGQMARVAHALQVLACPGDFRARYGLREERPVILFAVGDGNHSLAAAKSCYEEQKAALPPERWGELPSRYALCELGNLHDDALEFEPIHRVVFGVDPKDLLKWMSVQRPGGDTGRTHTLYYICADGEGELTVPAPTAQLTVGTLQSFLDSYLAVHTGAAVDYIHGADVVGRLARRPDAIGFLLPTMGKEELFPTVIHDGVLPRKTFSMGEARDKRFYLEGRRIR